MGEELAGLELANAAPGNQHTGQVDRLHDVTGPTLSDLGISKTQSSRWPLVAAISKQYWICRKCRNPKPSYSKTVGVP